MNSKSSSMLKAYENEFSEFLIKRLANAGGSLQLQHISGHLSQVKSEVRNAIGSSKSDLLQFLKKHNNLFIVQNNIVSLVNSSSFSTSGYDSDGSSTRSHSNLPSKIKQGKGVIIKLLSGYGFIKSKEPIKTEIFFNSLCFGDKDIDLTSFLHVGAIVFFNARQISSSKLSCKYHALKVWRIDNGDEDNVIIQKTRKTRETGLYDPLNLESEGVIQNVFPNLGFIAVKGDDKNTVFFHKNRVVNYDNIVDLTKVFSKGDTVEFTAHRSSKPDAKARWEATKVWKIAEKIEHNASQSVSSSQTSLPEQPVSDSRTKSHEMIKNQCGKIYPRSHGAVIKFGNNELVDGDSALYYVCGTHVTEIGWEFTEGDDVCFDAVKIKSAPGWKAVLVWTDKKPDIVLPTCLGDFSEFTEEEDNEEVSSSIYTSKSSLCMSESSGSSVKSQKMFSKAKDLKKGKAHKFSDNFVSKDIHKKMPKNYNTSSRDSLSSLPVSDKYCFAGIENNDCNKKLSKNHSTSRDSLNSLPVSDKYCFVGKENSDTNKKLSKNHNTSSRDSLNSLPVSDKYCFVGKENSDTNKKLSKNCDNLSRDSLSSLPVSDKYNLKRSEKVVKSSSNISIDRLSKMLSNWGDSPYPADEAYESMETSKSVKSDFSLKYSNKTKHFTEDETENSSEYASAEEEKLDKTTELENGKFSSDNVNLKCAASIKSYHDIKGEIKKVFSKFAEINSRSFQNAVSFSLNDFCLKGKFADELELDDLKNALKVGDSIYFNCFVIIDDLGQTWQKVTLAWKGSKSKYAEEISPEDFIKQNNLSVTINNETNNDETTEEVVNRRFLTSFVDEISDNIDNSSKTESCSDEESLTLSPKSQAHSKTELPIDFENLSDTVYKILKRDVFFNDSMVDIKSVSEEIINIIVQNCTKKTNTLKCNVLPEASYVTNSLENVCSKCKEENSSLSSNSAKMKNTAAQTIITGDIISQNILADC